MRFPVGVIGLIQKNAGTLSKGEVKMVLCCTGSCIINMGLECELCELAPVFAKKLDDIGGKVIGQI